EIEHAGEQAAPGDGTRQSLARVLDFVAHDGSEFEADEAETNYAKGIENEAGIRRNLEIGGGDVGAEAEIEDGAESDEKRGGDESADAAEVVDPFADAKADDVEDYENQEQENGRGQSETLVVGEGGVAGAEDVDGDAHEIEHDRR